MGRSMDVARSILSSSERKVSRSDWVQLVSMVGRYLVDGNARDARVNLAIYQQGARLANSTFYDVTRVLRAFSR